MFRAHWVCPNAILQRNGEAVTPGVKDRLRPPCGMVNIARGTLVTRRTKWTVAQVALGTLRSWGSPARDHRFLFKQEITTPNLRSAKQLTRIQNIIIKNEENNRLRPVFFVESRVLRFYHALRKSMGAFGEH